MLRLVLVVSLLVALSACGGHPATPAPDSPNPARGLYVSTYFYSQPTLIVLPDGRFFLPFRTLTTYGSQISGLGAGMASQPRTPSPERTSISARSLHTPEPSTRPSLRGIA